MRRRTASSNPPKAGRRGARLRSFKASSGESPSAPRVCLATTSALEAEAGGELEPPGREGRHRLPEQRRALVAHDHRVADRVEGVEDADAHGCGRSLFALGPVEMDLPGHLEIEVDE